MKYTVLVLLTTTMLFSACRAPKNAGNVTTANNTTNTQAHENTVQLRTEVVGTPTLGNATVNVYLLEDNVGVSGAKVEITGDMTHAGMIPVISEASEIEAGLYQTQDFSFTMAGDWFIVADVTLPSGEVLQQDIDVRVVSE